VYDPQNETHEFVGRDRAEAVAKATEFYGLPEDELVIGEAEPGRVAGVGARTVIVVYARSAGPPSRRASARPERDHGGEGRGEGRRRDARRPERRDRPERGERRERGDRPERSERPERRWQTEARVDSPQGIEPGERSEGSTVGTLSELGEFVKGLIERMEVGAFEISEARESNRLVAIQVRGSASARLAGGDGRAADAIQLLANQAALRMGGDDAPRVVVDVEGDAEGREAHLEHVAERAAKRAIETGRPVALEPMNARDRRAIHVALRDAEGIATMSVGDGRYKQVVVVPESAPEYEEARRYEAAALGGSE
jgi:spoIIIJ-associated protein